MTDFATAILTTDLNTKIIKQSSVIGEDPNWGRVTAAAGRSGAHVVPEKMDLFFDDQPLVLKGIWLGAEAEKKTAQIMKKTDITITLNLNLGKRHQLCGDRSFSDTQKKWQQD